MEVTGAVLQFLGVAVIARGIYRIRVRYTDRPGILGSVRSSWRRLIAKLRRSQPRLARELPGSVGAAASVSEADLRVRSDWSSLTTEEAVGRLGPMVEQLDERVRALRTGHAKDIHAVRGDLKSLRADLQLIQKALDERISSYAASGLKHETWGAALLMAGIVLSALG